MNLRKVNCRGDEGWLDAALVALREDGYCVVEEMLDKHRIPEIRAAMYRAQCSIRVQVGEERLRRAGELGVLRLAMKFEPILLSLIQIPELLALVDATVSPTAILHLQNAFVLPTHSGDKPDVFQTTLHPDFPRYLNGYLASVNALFAIDPFTRANGATFVVPGSHQSPSRPAPHLLGTLIPAECDAGSVIFFDSTLWHAAGSNTSGDDRLAVNHQFTRSWIKQQFDYVRALGEEFILQLPPRTQQLLGYYTRVVTSLDEYYRPEAERLYRGNQG